MALCELAAPKLSRSSEFAVEFGSHSPSELFPLAARAPHVAGQIHSRHVGQQVALGGRTQSAANLLVALLFAARPAPFPAAQIKMIQLGSDALLQLIGARRGPEPAGGATKIFLSCICQQSRSPAGRPSSRPLAMSLGAGGPSERPTGGSTSGRAWPLPPAEDKYSVDRGRGGPSFVGGPATSDHL